MGTTTLECAPVYIDGETYMGSDFSLEDQGGNVCTCEGDTVACQVLSSGLAPPGELGASQDSPP